MAHTRVLHLQRGFRMSKSYAEQVMRDHCTITWVSKEDLTIRDTTIDERLAMREEQTRQSRLCEAREGILGRNDLPNLRFEPPKNTNYRAPHEAYEDMEAPLAFRYCRWPRRAHEFVSKAA